MIMIEINENEFTKYVNELGVNKATLIRSYLWLLYNDDKDKYTKAINSRLCELADVIYFKINYDY